MTNSKLYAITN